MAFCSPTTDPPPSRAIPLSIQIDKPAIESASQLTKIATEVLRKREQAKKEEHRQNLFKILDTLELLAREGEFQANYHRKEITPEIEADLLKMDFGVSVQNNGNTVWISWKPKEG